MTKHGFDGFLYAEAMDKELYDNSQNKGGVYI